MRKNTLKRIHGIGCLVLVVLAATGCQKEAGCAGRGWDAGHAGADGDRALSPVPQSSEYVATIKSRRSATLQPQVSGPLTQIPVTPATM